MKKIFPLFSSNLTKGKENQLPKKPAGKVILILLLITSGLALLFYLSSLWPSWWQRVTAPRVINSPKETSGSDLTVLLTPSPSPAPWQTSLEEGINQILAEEPGTYGVYLYKIDEQQFLGINETAIFPAASLMKLPVIMTVYHQAEKQQFDLSAEYSLREADKLAGNGSVYLQPAGTTYTYRALAQLAIEQSDNTANYVLSWAVGEEQIRSMINLLGLGQTDYDLSQTSPQDIGRLLLALYQGEILTSAHSQEILGYLSATIFNDQIPAALPAGTKIAHKIGFDEGLLHDAAIIFKEDNNFILVVMSQSADTAQAEEVIKKIAKLVWQEIDSG
jgi:beta-lactamase class A